jgi:hypothetical protein
MSPEVWAAVIAGCVALISLPVTNSFTSRQEIKAKGVAFKIDCYQKFVNAFFGLSEHQSHETQLAFTQSVNLIALMGSKGVLDAIHKLNKNYESDGEDRQWQILDEILLQMRLDVIGRSDSVKKGYQFPVILTDIKPLKRGDRKVRQSQA